jgi:D-alanyl-D-alanine carboxypeptidase/D-alanyl-D-alanine-endopeptidase (penicillin-binding protein 4)
MLRIAALACLLLALLAPAAAAAGRAGTARALAAQMRSTGPAAGALAVDLDSGQTIYSRRANTQRMPASVQKLYTTVAVLRRLGPGGRLGTSVLAAAPPDELGVVRGDLYLRGGGDPTFGTRAARRLSRQLARAGVTRITGRVRGDEAAFDARRGVPSSGFRLTSDVGPLSALTFNRGRTGLFAPYWQRRPARFAATAFAGQLRKLGIVVPRGGATGVTPVGATPVAELPSAPVGTLVRLMNPPSDNFISEMLVKVLGARFGPSGSTVAGARVVSAELRELGIAPRVIDGSGLSRRDRTSPREVVTMLAAMRDDAIFSGSLAIAGRTGTLAYRMRDSSAQDRCLAKTGTLHDVSALAGYCRSAAGARVAFAFLMNRITPYSARILQDRMVVALARYRP